MASKRRILTRVKDTFDHYDMVIYAARGSNSAHSLAESLRCRRWRDDLPERYTRRRAYFRGRPYPMVINWGSTVRPDWGLIAGVVGQAEKNGFWINPQEAVARAIDKRVCFQTLDSAGVPSLKHCTDKDTVKKWLKKGKQVFVRADVKGSGGSGIKLLSSETDDVPDAPLYTRNYPKTHEFRVHVFNGEVIDIAEKKAKVGTDGRPVDATNRLVRNHRNGWTYAHQGISLDLAGKKAVGELAIAATSALGLVFGGVDVLAILAADNPRTLKSCVVCEINTGPGLENTVTIEAYKNAILKLFKAKGR